MILYFSGTGNSAHVAKLLGDYLKEECMRITDCHASSISFSGNSLGIVFPIYSWGVPPVMLDYIAGLGERFVEEASATPIWMVAVCGDETALAPEMLKKELSDRGLELSGGWSVQMPNNYVLLPGFDVDPKDVEQRKLDACDDTITGIARKISSCSWEESYVRGSMAWLKTKLIYPIFKKYGIYPSRWQSDERCTKCGLCASACPVSNITSGSDGKPCWHDNCTSCLACYHICPTHAVNYGSATRNKGHYFLPAYRKLIAGFRHKKNYQLNICAIRCILLHLCIVTINIS